MNIQQHLEALAPDEELVILNDDQLFFLKAEFKNETRGNTINPTQYLGTAYLLVKNRVYSITTYYKDSLIRVKNLTSTGFYDIHVMSEKVFLNFKTALDLKVFILNFSEHSGLYFKADFVDLMKTLNVSSVNQLKI